MKTLVSHRRTLATVLLTLFAAATFAPAADAGHAYGHRRWKGGPPVQEVRYVQPAYYAPSVQVYHHSSNAGPVLAGIVGGIVLGAALANSHPVVVHTEYSYWDPYCHESYASLDDYQAHLYYHHHPREVRVIEVDNGQCVRNMYWSDGGWCSGGYDNDGDWHR
jgi:hypothetical protein